MSEGPLNALDISWFRNHLPGGEAAYPPRIQIDAQEVLGDLLEAMHSDLTGFKEPESASVSQSSTPDPSTIVSRLFRWIIRPRLTCACGEHRNPADEPLWMLNLSFPPDRPLLNKDGEPADKVPSLEDLIDAFLAEQDYSQSSDPDGECPRCHTWSDAKKQYTIVRLPPVLVFHLVRWHSDTAKMSGRFPYPRVLDMQKYVDNANCPQSSCRYRLVSVVQHNGTIASGHYIAYVRTVGHELYECSDAEITQFSEDKKMLEAEAYVLFYVRVNL
jgi:ubiquitin C-terminal hydrolase